MIFNNNILYRRHNYASQNWSRWKDIWQKISWTYWCSPRIRNSFTNFSQGGIFLKIKSTNYFYFQYFNELEKQFVKKAELKEALEAFKEDLAQQDTKDKIEQMDEILEKEIQRKYTDSVPAKVKVFYNVFTLLFIFLIRSFPWGRWWTIWEQR